MPNRYSTPAEAQFMNTYSPIPFQELLQAGLSKQQQYNTGRDYLDSAETNAENLKYIAGSKDESYIKDNVLATVKEIVNEHGSKDLSDPNIMRTVIKKLKGIDSQRINRVQQSAQAHSQFSQDVNKLGLAGKGADYLNKFDPTNFSSEFGVFNQTPEAKLDYKTAAESYFKDMEDSYLGIKDITPGLKAMVHGIPKSTLLKRADDIAEDYMNSPEGRQHVKQFLNDGISEEDIPAAMTDYVRRTALEFKKDKVSSPFRDPSYSTVDSGSNGSNTNESVSYNFPGEPLPKDQTTYKGATTYLEELKRAKADPTVIQQYQNLLKPAEEAKVNFISKNIGANRAVMLSRVKRNFPNLDKESSNRINEAIEVTASRYKESESFYKNLYGADYKGIEGAYMLPKIEEVYKELNGSDIPTSSANDLNKLNSYVARYDMGIRIASNKGEKEAMKYFESDDVNKSISQEMISIPPIKMISGVAHTWDANEGKWSVNASSQLYNIILNTATPQQVVPADNNDDRKLKEYSKATDKTIIGNGIDVKGTFLHVQIGNSDPDNPAKDYKVYLPTNTQRKSLAKDYAKFGDKYNYVRSTYPMIESIVEYQTNAGGSDEFSIPLSATEKIVAVRQEDGQYLLGLQDDNSSAEPETFGPIPATEISHTAYQMLSNNLK